MEFRVLGPLEVVNDDGRPLRLGGGRQLALVAYLLLHANHVVSVEQLVDGLWGDSAPPTAAKIVRNYVSLLRRELGDHLVTQPPGYLLRIGDGELDSRQLELAIASGDLDELDHALARWRGSPLSQVAYEPFAQGDIARLEELRLTAIEAQIGARLELGRHAATVPELESLVRENPLRERLREQLMLALYRSGRQADALEVYRDARRTLDRELGIDPGPALRELERKILVQDDSLAAPVEARAIPQREESRGRRRRLAMVVVGALVLLGAAVAAALVATRESTAIVEVPPNSVGVFDPDSNDTVAVIPVGIRPGSLTAGAGWVWVANLDDRNVTRIDADQRSVAGTVSLDDRTATGLAFGAGALWVAHGLGGELSRVDPQLDRVTESIAVTNRALSGSVAFDVGRLWAAYGDSTLVRIRPDTVNVTGSGLTGALPLGVAVGDGAVWVVNAGDSTVQRFDPLTFEEGAIREVSVGGQASAIAYGEGAVWVANRGDDTVTRIDPTTHGTLDVPVGDQPAAVAVGAGGVWVANAGDGSVSRIDPETYEAVEQVVVGGSPAGLVVAEGLLWVAVQAP